MMKADLPYYLTTFLSKYLPGEKNASLHTIQSYSFTFKLLLIFFESVKSITPELLAMSDLTRDAVTDFLDWLESTRGCSITTRNQRLVAIHSFVRFVQKQSLENLYEFQRILNIPNKKCAKTVVPFLTGNEMKILLSMPDPSNKNGLRDLVLLALLYDSAARVQEIIDLKVKDLRLKKPAVITLHGKGQKTRHVPITEKTKSLLQSYLKCSSNNTGISTGEEYVFVNQKKQPFSRWGISYIIGKYVDMAKLQEGFDVRFPVTAHVFRHSKSVHLLQSGVNLVYIRDLLGHCDCSTTQIYAKADTETRRKALEAAYIDILPTNELPDWSDDKNLMDFLNTLSR
ncbi:site-specific recombinase XerD [Muricomes intestini]|jgi:site-specific recombinase XerD|uniref:Site-specific recombinase XerD n=1 Tax=Muricomes intestini TaxID=1796634 RepID=A0A4R3KBP6_9FIRM|nr:tyrosine-type recombinase/integrase [Muricomes intestini]TCS80319.1 site-specific recombinase XerD [Muricomes intestini]